MTFAEGAALVGIGIVTGIVSGILGLGGGLAMVPAMVLLLGYQQHLAEGTSLLVILPTAAVGAYTHSRQGYVRVRPAIALAAGGIAGALAGSGVALALGGPALRLVFVAYLTITGLWMILARGRGERADQEQTPGSDGSGAAR